MFFAYILHEKFYGIIFYRLAEFQYQNFFTSQDIISQDRTSPVAAPESFSFPA